MSRSRSGSRSRSRSGRRLGARRSPLGMRRTHRDSKINRSFSKWRRRGLPYPKGSRSRKSWAQKAIKDAFSIHKKRKQAKRRSLLATTKGKFGKLPNELGGFIRKLTTMRGGYKIKKRKGTKKNRRSTRSKSSSNKKTTKRTTRNRRR